ncbi:hypothetical protein [Variovorax sp. KK3]|nr:hypothetical protein [Variovorax sp. KK3]
MCKLATVVKQDSTVVPQYFVRINQRAAIAKTMKAMRLAGA